jgi:Ni2+-binding GTPase involved in maturation of urease and hydrogenase
LTSYESKRNYLTIEISGPRGSGKTTLACQIINFLKQHKADVTFENERFDWKPYEKVLQDCANVDWNVFEGKGKKISVFEHDIDDFDYRDLQIERLKKEVEDLNNKLWKDCELPD